MGTVINIIMERKLGYVFQYDGKWYQVIEGYGCYNCDFRYYDCCSKKFLDMRGFCGKTLREDKICVIFKKLKTVRNKKKE